MSKGILIISQYHTPEVGAAATRWRDYAAILSRSGFKVTVLTEIPNYPFGAVFESYKYLKPVYERNLTQGYDVIRVPVWVNKRKTTLQRLGFYFSFVFTSLMVMKKLPHFNHVIVSSPPLTVGIIGYLIKRLSRKRMILDIRDIWPESAVVLGELKSGLSKKAAFFLEDVLYKSSDCFLTAVPGFKGYLEEKAAGKGIISLPNGVSSAFIKLADEEQSKPDRKFTVLFSGNIGLAQDLEKFILAAELLKDKDINFTIIGNGARKEDIVQLSETKNLSNVKFLEPVDQKQLVQEIKRSSVCIVPLIKSDLFKNAIPSKMIEYMACSRPVIVTIYGEVEELLRKSGGGIISAPGDPNKLANSILHYFDNPEDILIHGRKGREHVVEHWIKETLALPLIEYLNK